MRTEESYPLRITQKKHERNCKRSKLDGEKERIDSSVSRSQGVKERWGEARRCGLITEGKCEAVSGILPMNS